MLYLAIVALLAHLSLLLLLLLEGNTELTILLGEGVSSDVQGEGVGEAGAERVGGLNVQWATAYNERDCSQWAEA